MGIPEEREMLLSKLIDEGYLRTEKVINAFRDVRRELFVSESDALLAYKDYPIDIGHGQTISAPHMVAMMTELLKPRKSDTVLEIGSGSGYQAGILSRLVSSVCTIEVLPDLALMAKRNIDRAGYKNVSVVIGDGSAGYPAFAQYDRIIVTCATPEISRAWKDQLRPGGIIVAPVGGFYHQELMAIKKTDDSFAEERHGGCVFVPLKQA